MKLHMLILRTLQNRLSIPSHVVHFSFFFFFTGWAVRSPGFLPAFPTTMAPVHLRRSSILGSILDPDSPLSTESGFPMGSHTDVLLSLKTSP